MSRAAKVFPEVTKLRLPEGMLDQLHATARKDGTTAAELMRRVLKRALEEYAEKAAA